jgi:hypothetical protein
MSLYTGASAPHQQGMQPQVPQMDPQAPNYQQQMAQALASPLQQGDMSGIMKMIQQLTQMQQKPTQIAAPTASSPGMDQLPMTPAPSALG